MKGEVVAHPAKELPAAPKYSVGQRVRYKDHTDRLQVGAVRMIEARWNREAGEPPFLSYTVWHPTYAGKKMYLAEDSILGAETV